jgi:hypothetical protein
MHNWQLKAIVVALSLGTAATAGAQTSSSTAGSTGMSSPATNSTEGDRKACAGLTGTAMRDCLRTHSSAGDNAGSTTSKSRSMQSGRDSMRRNPHGSQGGSSSDSGNASGAAGASSGTGASGSGDTGSASGGGSASGSGGSASGGASGSGGGGGGGN